MARKLERLLPPFIVDRLRAVGVEDCDAFYELSDIQLMVICNMGRMEALDLRADISEKLVARRGQTAQELLEQRAKVNLFLSCGAQKLDEALGGGLSIGTLVEVCGPPGVGKSQLCLSFCASVLMQRTSASSEKRSVIYLDTELKFSASRLLEILTQRNSDCDVNDAMKRINVKRLSSAKQLYESIENLQAEVISQSVSLVVIDSIAALARKEALNETERDTFILQQGALLKRIAEKCQCVVLTTNQVMVQDDSFGGSVDGFTDTFQSILVSSSGTISEHSRSLEKRLRPALGTSWFHTVTTRIIMSVTVGSYQVNRDDYVHSERGAELVNGQRLLQVVKSPMCILQTAPFLIGPKGVESVLHLS